MRFREACEEERGERWIIFLRRQPSRGTATSGFHFGGKTRVRLSYGRDNKRCFTAHDALCLSICSTLVIILPVSVWLTASVCCLLITDCACLSICFTAGWCFTLLPCHFVPSLSECFAGIGLQGLIVSRDDHRIGLTNHSSVMWQTQKYEAENSSVI